VPRLGPLKIIIEHDLAQIRDVRVVESGGGGDVLIRFDDENGSHGLGGAMSRPEAERLAEAVRGAATAVSRVAPLRPAPAAQPPRPKSPVEAPPPPLEVDAPSITSASGLALIAANLVPLAGVLFFQWDLASVLILYWAESAVIGFYTALKIVVVGKLAAFVAVPAFVGHFGGFMAIHFLLIYSFFVRGVDAAGPDPGAREALSGIFSPLWFPLATLFLSHGVSFVSNFIGRQEYTRSTVKGLMNSPYSRILAMQMTLIVGGWILLLLRSPAAVLAVLVLIKTAADFSAHRREHR
jgi:hypothetical protein